MTKANLAWNGLAYEGSVALSEMLNGNLYLLELDVTSNRINWEGARLVARGLSKNIYLQILRVSTPVFIFILVMDIFNLLCS